MRACAHPPHVRARQRQPPPPLPACPTHPPPAGHWVQQPSQQAVRRPVPGLRRKWPVRPQARPLPGRAPEAVGRHLRRGRLPGERGGASEGWRPQRRAPQPGATSAQVGLCVLFMPSLSHRPPPAPPLPFLQAIGCNNAAAPADERCDAQCETCQPNGGCAPKAGDCTLASTRGLLKGKCMAGACQVSATGDAGCHGRCLPARAPECCSTSQRVVPI